IDDLFLKKEKTFITADERFKRFLYEDYLLDIHGLAPPLYRNLPKDLEKFYSKYKDQFDIIIVSKENWFTIPPTLFFLSKLMPRMKQYIFAEDNEELWSKVDILITTDPELFKTKPEDKVCIKIDRPW